MMKSRTRLDIALTLNLLVVFFEAYALFGTFFNADGSFNWQFLQYYTHYCNVFVFIAAIYVSLELVKEIGSKHNIRTNYVSRLLKFMSTSMIMLTFLVVIFVLVPSNGFRDARYYLFKKNFIFEHLLCPILCFLSVTVFGDYRDFSRKEALLSVLPTFIYAVAITVLNLLRVIEGPFSFFKVYSQSWYASVLWFTGLVGGAYLIALALLYLARKIRISE